MRRFHFTAPHPVLDVGGMQSMQRSASRLAPSLCLLLGATAASVCLLPIDSRVVPNLAASIGFTLLFGGACVTLVLVGVRTGGRGGAPDALRSRLLVVSILGQIA